MKIPRIFQWVAYRQNQVLVQVDGKAIGHIDKAVADLLTNDKSNFDLVFVPDKLINFIREQPQQWVELTLTDKRFKVMVSRFSNEGRTQYRLHSSAGVAISPVFYDPQSLSKWCMDVFTDTFGFDAAEAITKLMAAEAR